MRSGMPCMASAILLKSCSFWLVDRALRPVRTITQTARQISETDLEKRLHLPGDDVPYELAIVQWIAHAHHGDIRVESLEGKGSTFEVILTEYNPSEGV